MSLEKMTPSDISALERMILSSYMQGNYIRSRILTEKMARIGNKRQQRQIMKYLLDFFILKKNIFSALLSQSLQDEIGNSQLWNIDSIQIQVAYAQKFIRILKKLIEDERFEPQKITTIRSLNTKMFTMAPSDFQFLFTTGLIQLGKNFQIKKHDSSVFASAFSNIRHFENRIRVESTLPSEKRLSNFLKKRDINPTLFYNLDKKRFYEVYNFFENLKFLAYYEKTDASIRNQVLSVIGFELASLMQPDKRLVSAYNRPTERLWEKIITNFPGETPYTEEERDALKTMLRKKGSGLYLRMMEDFIKTEEPPTDFFKPEDLSLI